MLGETHNRVMLPRASDQLPMTSTNMLRLPSTMWNKMTAIIPSCSLQASANFCHPSLKRILSSPAGPYFEVVTTSKSPNTKEAFPVGATPITGTSRLGMRCVQDQKVIVRRKNDQRKYKDKFSKQTQTSPVRLRSVTVNL